MSKMLKPPLPRHAKTKSCNATYLHDIQSPYTSFRESTINTSAAATDTEKLQDLIQPLKRRFRLAGMKKGKPKKLPTNPDSILPSILTSKFANNINELLSSCESPTIVKQSLNFNQFDVEKASIIINQIPVSLSRRGTLQNTLRSKKKAYSPNEDYFSENIRKKGDLNSAYELPITKISPSPSPLLETQRTENLPDNIIEKIPNNTKISYDKRSNRRTKSSAVESGEHLKCLINENGTINTNKTSHTKMVPSNNCSYKTLDEVFQLGEDTNKVIDWNASIFESPRQIGGRKLQAPLAPLSKGSKVTYRNRDDEFRGKQREGFMKMVYKGMSSARKAPEVDRKFDDLFEAKRIAFNTKLQAIKNTKIQKYELLNLN